MSPGPFVASYRGTPRAVRGARAAIVDFARLCGFETADLVDVALAAGEALANAVEHGNKDLGFIGVTCTFENGELAIEIRDEGAGFEAAELRRSTRDPLAVRGFGISIMRAVMDGVDYRNRGTNVRLRKRLTPSAAAQARTETGES